MDRERALKHLAEVEQIVALGLKHIADQEFRMSQLDGDDSGPRPRPTENLQAISGLA
jgi:hypothetical protein